MEVMEICSIPVIAALCYGLIEVCKRLFGKDSKIKNAYPLIAALTGTFLGVLTFLVEPELMMADSVLGAALAGMVSGLSATGGNQIVQRMQKQQTAQEENTVETDDTDSNP